MYTLYLLKAYLLIEFALFDVWRVIVATLIKAHGSMDKLQLLWRQKLLYGAHLCLFIITIVSPIVMISLPKMDLLSLKHSQLKCSVGCEGLKISIIFKLIILSIAYWAVLHKSTPTSLPKLDLIKMSLTILSILLISLYWIFYLLQFTPNNKPNMQYEAIVEFASGFITSLLYLQYLFVLIHILRPALGSGFLIHIIRNEDGTSNYIQVSVSIGILII